ncbi:hypothetical protein LJB82_04310, partial [Desulfovibrio sp. OttesenSCG-928-M16]|nr:hypothetical protein [Desulfovibrio sp. OttesenSCG-928-M16]
MNRKREVRLPFVPKSGHSPAGPAQRILRRQSGGLARLTKAPGRGGLTRRKGALPYWRNLNTALAKGRPVSEQRLNLWLLVLTAKHMPHRLIGAGGSPRLYVPCLYEGLALHDIRAVEQERSAPLFVPPAHDNAPWVLAFLLLLFVWHGLRFQWFGALLPAPPFPATPGLWPALFGLDMPRFREAHEIWRAVTALTLHADDAHLFGNLGF